MGNDIEVGVGDPEQGLKSRRVEEWKSGRVGKYLG